MFRWNILVPFAHSLFPCTFFSPFGVFSTQRTTTKLLLGPLIVARGQKVQQCQNIWPPEELKESFLILILISCQPWTWLKRIKNWAARYRSKRRLCFAPIISIQSYLWSLQRCFSDSKQINHFKGSELLFLRPGPET